MWCSGNSCRKIKIALVIFVWTIRSSVLWPIGMPLPRIKKSLTCLKQSCWYCTLDLTIGYWQVEVNRENTAPICLYEFEAIPFRLRNAPGTIHQVMQRCLNNIVNNFLLIYLDDIIVFSAGLLPICLILNRWSRIWESTVWSSNTIKCKRIQERGQCRTTSISRDTTRLTVAAAAADSNGKCCPNRKHGKRGGVEQWDGLVN